MKPVYLIPMLVLPLAVQAAVPIQRWHTAEGTQVLLTERRDNPIIDVEINFKGAGSAADPAGKGQTAAFTATLLTDGTRTLDEEAFRTSVDNIAARISSSNSSESASLRLRSLSKPDTLKQAAALANSALTQPRFDPAVFARVQNQAVAALRQRETKPEFAASRALTKLNYPQHPYGGSANITADSLKKVSLDDIRAFHRSHYGKNNAVVAIVGDISRSEADRLVADLLNGLPERSSAAKPIPPVAEHQAQRRDMPFAGEQAQIMLGMPLITRADPDYYALTVGNYILGGGGFDSRLMKVLRDRHGYTYGVHSHMVPTTEKGAFNIVYSTQKKNAAASLEAARAVIGEFVAEGPSEDELAQAKANITGGFPLRFDSNAKLLNYLSLIGLYNLPDSYLEDYPKAVSALTAAQIKETWQRRVKPENLNIVVVGAENPPAAAGKKRR